MTRASTSTPVRQHPSTSTTFTLARPQSRLPGSSLKRSRTSTSDAVPRGSTRLTDTSSKRATPASRRGRNGDPQPDEPEPDSQAGYEATSPVEEPDGTGGRKKRKRPGRYLDVSDSENVPGQNTSHPGETGGNAVATAKTGNAADQDGTGNAESGDVNDAQAEIEREKELEAWQDFAMDHYEMVEQLPLELHRNYRLLRELDEGCIAQTEKLHKLIREYIALRLYTIPVAAAAIETTDRSADDATASPAQGDGLKTVSTVTTSKQPQNRNAAFNHTAGSQLDPLANVVEVLPIRNITPPIHAPPATTRTRTLDTAPTRATNTTGPEHPPAPASATESEAAALQAALSSELGEASEMGKPLPGGQGGLLLVPLARTVEQDAALLGSGSGPASGLGPGLGPGGAVQVDTSRQAWRDVDPTAGEGATDVEVTIEKTDTEPGTQREGQSDRVEGEGEGEEEEELEEPLEDRPAQPRPRKFQTDHYQQQSTDEPSSEEVVDHGWPPRSDPERLKALGLPSNVLLPGKYGQSTVVAGEYFHGILYEAEERENENEKAEHSETYEEKSAEQAQSGLQDIAEGALGSTTHTREQDAHEQERRRRGEEAAAILPGIARLAREIVRNGEEKVAVAMGTYNSVDRHIRALDSALSAQEASILLGLRPSTLPSAAAGGNLPVSATDAGLSMAFGQGQGQAILGEEEEQVFSLGVGGGGAVNKGKKKGKKGRKGQKDDGGVVAGDGAGGGEAELREGLMLQARPVGFEADASEPRYCYCNEVSYGEMIGCDNDDCPFEWFHHACVGLTTIPAGKWLCEVCKGNPNPFEVVDPVSAEARSGAVAGVGSARKKGKKSRR